MINTSCAFTGHRAEKLPWGYNEADFGCIKLKNILREEIERKIGLGVNVFYSGGQNGIDLIAGEIVLLLKKEYPFVRLVVVLPFEGIADRWSEGLRDRFFSVMENCDEEVVLSRKYYDGCYKARNHYMVDRAKHLIAVWDMGLRSSGTYQTMMYAKMRNRDITVIDPVTTETEKIIYQN